MQPTTDRLDAILSMDHVTGVAQGGWVPNPSYVIHKPTEYFLGPIEAMSVARPITDADRWSERTVAELARAREVIIERGWIQYSLATPEGVCVLGAARLSADDMHRKNVVSSVLSLSLRVRENEIASVDGWNDTPGRTQAEVLDFLDRTIIFVKEKISNG